MQKANIISCEQLARPNEPEAKHHILKYLCLEFRIQNSANKKERFV